MRIILLLALACVLAVLILRFLPDTPKWRSARLLVRVFTVAVGGALVFMLARSLRLLL